MRIIPFCLNESSQKSVNSIHDNTNNEYPPNPRSNCDNINKKEF